MIVDNGIVYLTTAEAAIRRGVNGSRIRQLVLANRLPGTRKIGRDLYVPEKSLDALGAPRPGRPELPDKVLKHRKALRNMAKLRHARDRQPIRNSSRLPVRPTLLSDGSTVRRVPTAD